MSRLRFPFRSQPSSTQVNGAAPLPVIKDANADYWRDVEAPGLEKGKAKEVERLWGLENFGNTCYCNSVLQALYACHPFREFVESYPNIPPPISPLAPPPGTASQPLTTPVPTSPFATTKADPFDNPALNHQAPTSPTGGGDKSKEKRSWTSLGRRPTSSGNGPSNLVSSQQGPQAAPAPTPLPPNTPSLETPPIPLNSDQPPPSVFETIQTLFKHLSISAPHQPLPPKKAVNADANSAQTASLLPAGPSAIPGSQPLLTPSSTVPLQPQGPPLLASLPPPSAPRGGGPFSAGSLGRGVVRPEDLLKTVKRENEMFRGMSQQDAHEFLGWVLNKIAEDVEVVDRALRKSESRAIGKTFVQNLFEGTLTNETRCLSCEMTSSRDELFLDLSIDIEQHSSVTACLRQFSASEMLCQKNKFYCDSCCGLQEAEKRLKIKRLPNVLALHLKRFKYQENLGRYTKLFYRVPFPTQLRLPNTSDDSENPDRLYELFSVVVHIGNGPHHGHYVCLIRSAGRWVMCDDENVEPIDEADVYRYFGDYPSGAGYVLFYQAVDLDLEALGLKRPPPSTPPQSATVSPAYASSAIVAQATIASANVASSAVLPPTQPENLMDIVEDSEELGSPSPKSPLKVDIPPPSPSVLMQASPVSPIAASSPVVSTPLRKVNPSQGDSYPSSVERNDTTPSSTSIQRRSSYIAARAGPPSPLLSKEKEGKWYQLKRPNEKDRRLSTGPPTLAAARASAGEALVTPTKAPLQRQGTSPNVNPAASPQTGSSELNGLSAISPPQLRGDNPGGVMGVPVPTATGQTPPRRPSGAEVSTPALSSSVISNTSASAASASSASSSPAYGSLGRNQPQSDNANSTRNRTTSTSSVASASGEKKEPGGLTRRLSGMRRSGSMVMKLGLGKKDKDKGMDGVEEEGSAKKGLL